MQLALLRFFNEGFRQSSGRDRGHKTACPWGDAGKVEFIVKQRVQQKRMVIGVARRGVGSRRHDGIRADHRVSPRIPDRIGEGRQ